ncbi:MAG: hypothetical protein WCC01_07805 [Acidimicrobiia bacterium]
MHIPDGVFGSGRSAATGAVAACGFGLAVSRAHRYPTDRLGFPPGSRIEDVAAP